MVTDKFDTGIKGVFDPEIDMPKEEQKEAPKTISELKTNIRSNPYFDTPKEKDVEENWARRSNKKLKQRGSGYRVRSIFWSNFLITVLILTIIIGVSFVSWGIYNDKFKTQIFDNSSVVYLNNQTQYHKTSQPLFLFVKYRLPL